MESPENTDVDTVEASVAPQAPETGLDTNPILNPITEQPLQNDPLDPLTDLGDTVTKDEETGEFVLKSGETIYKGKTIKDLLAKVSEGIVHKDNVIAKSQLTKALRKGTTDRLARSDNGRDDETEEAQATPPPPKEDLYRKHLLSELKQSGVDPKRLSWTNEQWKEFQRENDLEGWEITDERQKVAQVRTQARELTDTEYGDLNARYRSRQEVDGVIEYIAEGIADYGLKMSSDEAVEFFDGIIKKAQSMDDRAYNADGSLKGSFLVNLAHKELRSLADTQGESRLKSKVLADVARGREAKDRINSAPGSTALHKERIKPATDYEGAYGKTLAAYRARQGK